MVPLEQVRHGGIWVSLWDGQAPTVVIPQDAWGSSSWFSSGMLGIPIMVNHRDTWGLPLQFFSEMPGIIMAFFWMHLVPIVGLL